jgi:hypothetical protein
MSGDVGLLVLVAVPPVGMGCSLAAYLGTGTSVCLPTRLLSRGSYDAVESLFEYIPPRTSMEVIGWYGCTRGSRVDSVAISGETLVQRCLPGPGHPTWRALPPPPPTIVPACPLDTRAEAVYMEYHTIRMSALGDINMGCCSLLGGVVRNLLALCHLLGDSVNGIPDSALPVNGRSLR